MTLAVGSLILPGGAHAADDSLLDAFEANLAAHASATEALRQWCQTRGIADAAQITARFVPGNDAPPPPGLRTTLGVSEAEPLGYRHVQLVCGDVVLSQAHNWFVPARLTADMNRQLAQTNRPFGRVAADLNFSRQPIASARRGAPACPAGAISAHRALLRLPDGSGLALVVECYTAANLAPAP
jgi:hypothetical protein